MNQVDQDCIETTEGIHMPVYTPREATRTPTRLSIRTERTEERGFPLHWLSILVFGVGFGLMLYDALK